MKVGGTSVRINGMIHHELLSIYRLTTSEYYVNSALIMQMYQFPNCANTFELIELDKTFAYAM